MQENPILDVLTREGVLINVSVRYWRATKKLNPEDLGLTPEQVTDRLISLGHKKLLPKEALRPFTLIEGRARSVIDNNTFPFLEGLSHFLPNEKLEEATRQLAELEAEFAQAKQRFLDHYVEMRTQASAEWSQIAHRLVPDPQRLVAAIEASFPLVERMEKQFGFNSQLFQIRIPESMEIQLITAGEQIETIHARQAAAQNAAEQIRTGVQSFVTDCVSSLREQTAQLCEEMLQSMNSGKCGVHQKTLNRLIRFIDQFKDLNFVGDRDMEEHLERVRQEFLLRTAQDYRDDESARTQLQQGIRALADKARQMAQEDTRQLVERFGQMGQRRFHLAS